MKIVFLTRSLEVGGTERQLVNLAAGLEMRGHSVHVLSFYSEGPFSEELTGKGVRVTALQKSGRWDVVRFGRSLRGTISSLQPDILYSMLPIPNLAAAFARLAMRRPPKLVWGLRSASMDLSHYDLMIRLGYTAERLLRRMPDAIIANSEAAQRSWSRRRHVEVVPNGIDVSRFVIDRSERRRLRMEFGIPHDAVVIGNVGRLDPVKDHRTFLSAAAMLHAADSALRFLVVGTGDGRYEKEMREFAATAAIADVTHWAGARADMPAVYNAIDVLALSSTSEAFPNVVAEALACGVTSVATDVGDCRSIIGDDSFIVPPRDSARLAQAVARAYAADDGAAAEKRRRRIVDSFSVEAMVERTEKLLELLRS